MSVYRNYVIAVSDNPRIPVGSHVDLCTRAITWVSATWRPDGGIGDLTAIRTDHVCHRCLEVGEVHYADHDCPRRAVPPVPEPPAPEPWTPHPDQLDLLEGLDA